MTNKANEEIKESKMASRVDEEYMWMYKNNWIQRQRLLSSEVKKSKKFSKKDFHI